MSQDQATRVVTHKIEESFIEYRPGNKPPLIGTVRRVHVIPNDSPKPGGSARVVYDVTYHDHTTAEYWTPAGRDVIWLA
jgi:hypothetical protein